MYQSLVWRVPFMGHKQSALCGWFCLDSLCTSTIWTRLNGLWQQLFPCFLLGCNTNDILCKPHGQCISILLFEKPSFTVQQIQDEFLLFFVNYRHKTFILEPLTPEEDQCCKLETHWVFSHYPTESVVFCMSSIFVITSIVILSFFFSTCLLTFLIKCNIF